MQNQHMIIGKDVCYDLKIQEHLWTAKFYNQCSDDTANTQLSLKGLNLLFNHQINTYYNDAACFDLTLIDHNVTC